MTYELSTPVIYENETYDLGFISLSSGPIPRGGDYTTSVVLSVIPGRMDGDTLKLLPAKTIKIVASSDIVGQGSQEELIAFGQINAVVVNFVRSKSVLKEEEINARRASTKNVTQSDSINVVKSIKNSESLPIKKKSWFKRLIDLIKSWLKLKR